MDMKIQQKYEPLKNSEYKINIVNMKKIVNEVNSKLNAREVSIIEF